MTGEWTTVGSIAEIFDGPHATPKKIDKGPYFLSISSLENGKLDLSKSARISNEQFIKWTKRVTPEAGDLLFSYETRLGEAALMPEGIRACLGRRMGLLRPDRSKVDPRFLLFAYLGPNFQQEIRTRTNYGATVERIALKELPDFPIRLPSLDEQKAIAHILGTLDDKIELNRQMNATLEAMAQAQFKSWFVDFDPVIDNALAAGNPIPEPLQARAEARKALDDKCKPLPEEIRKQFPSSFVFTEEMGWVPEGWEIIGFNQLADLDTTSVKPFDEPDTVWEHYSIPSFDYSGMPSRQRGEEIKSNKYQVKQGAILSSKLNPETERTWWPLLMDEQTAICSTEFMQFIPHKIEEQAFVYSLIRSKPFQANILERVTGSTGSRQRAQPKLIAKINVIDCGNILRQTYAQKATPILKSSRENLLQIESLKKLRDTLLPKLLSGQLLLPEAEQQVAEAVNPMPRFTDDNREKIKRLLDA